jgi:hypothetical protein
MSSQRLRDGGKMLKGKQGEEMLATDETRINTEKIKKKGKTQNQRVKKLIKLEWTQRNTDVE